MYQAHRKGEFKMPTKDFSFLFVYTPYDAWVDSQYDPE